MRSGRSSGRSSVDRPGGAQGGPRDAYQLSTRSSRHRPALLQPVQARHSHARAGRAVPVHDAWGLRRTREASRVPDDNAKSRRKASSLGRSSGRKQDRCPNWLLREQRRGGLAYDRSWGAKLPFDRRQTATGMWRQTAADCVTLGVSPLGSRLQSKGWAEESTQQGRSLVEGLGFRPRRTPVRRSRAPSPGRNSGDAGHRSIQIRRPAPPLGRISSGARPCSSPPPPPASRGLAACSSDAVHAALVPGPAGSLLPIRLHCVHSNGFEIAFNSKRNSINF
jgi:hypothetical protein